MGEGKGRIGEVQGMSRAVKLFLWICNGWINDIMHLSKATALYNIKNEL